MKKDLGPISAVFPMPVLMIATYGSDGTVDVMNAAWGMIGAEDKIVLFLDEDHKTTKNILERKAFTVSLADKAHMDAADYYGMASGNDTPDKFARTGYTAVKSGYVDAPVIEEFPIAMECLLADIIDRDNIYAAVGKIVNVRADEAVLGDDGKVAPEKLNALIFDTFGGGYYSVGEKAGQAWNEGAVFMDKQ